MNKPLLTLIGALTLGAATPAALARADWQAVAQTREAMQPTQVEPHGALSEAKGSTTAGLKCPPRAPRPLLDHGPRAQTTPYQNQLRQQRYEAALKACQAAGQ